MAGRNALDVPEILSKAAVGEVAEPGGLVFTSIFTILPAYQASRIYPAEALRYEQPGRIKQAGLPSRAQITCRPTSLAWRSALRSRKRETAV
jgi:hypothetical protein